jgi:pilus assembly protein CpaB
MMVVIAAVCAVVTAGGLYRFLSGVTPTEAQAQTPQTLVVAASNLPRGAVVKPDQLRLVDQTGPMPAGAFRTVSPVIGRTVKQSIRSGSMVTEDALASSGSLLEARLAPGFRAVGVFVDGRGGLQNYLQAGDRVDVVVTTEQEQSGSASKVVLQDIEILEIPKRESTSTYEEANAWMSVVLAVTPRDAERLALAMHVGSIQLLGRGSHDTRMQTTSGVTRDTLLPDPGFEGSAGASYQSVEIIKGQSRTQERFSLESNGWVERPNAAEREGE